MEGDARQIASPADDSANSRSLFVLWRFSSEVVGATGFEPATPCAQGRCATRLRYAPTRQEYSENDARRHEALPRRAFVALCVAPCGAFRRGQANLARSRNDSGGGGLHGVARHFQSILDESGRSAAWLAHLPWVKSRPIVAGFFV